MDSRRTSGLIAALATVAATAALAMNPRFVLWTPAAPVDRGRLARGVLEEIVGETRRRTDARGGDASSGARLDGILRDLGVPVPRSGTPSGAGDRSVAAAIQSRTGAADLDRRLPRMLTRLARLRAGREPQRSAPPERTPRPGASPPSAAPGDPRPPEGLASTRETPASFWGGGVAGTAPATPSPNPTTAPGTAPATPSPSPAAAPGTAPGSDTPDTAPEDPPLTPAPPATPPVDTL